MKVPLYNNRMGNIMLDLVDYGGGNVGSVRRCLERLHLPYQTVTPQAPPSGKNPMILPGVGAFGAMMTALQVNDLDQHLKALLTAGTPCLGICVGLQVLFETSEENPEAKGLGLLAGSVVKFVKPSHTTDNTLKIPQIGWNHISPQQDNWPSGEVYFVNSYYAQPTDPEVNLYQATYGSPFCAAIRHQNLTAFQFHPEKSGAFGHQLITHWVEAL
jgi:imidazole glycerol phosphate synthase glutamine amidotransferase subunit